MTWFNAHAVDPASGSSQFPVGRWPVVIKSSTRTAVKDKPNFGFLALNCEIIDGPHKGVNGVYRLNLWNESAQACEIAQKQLSAICHVTNTFTLADQTNMCSELFGKPFCIVVSQQTADPRYTQIDGVTDMNGNVAQKVAAPAQGQPQQQPGFAPPAQQPMQQQPQQPAQPSWQGPAMGGAPIQPPTGQPQWQQQPNPSAPQQPPQAGFQPPAQQQAPGQPSWAQQPPTGATPSWQR